MTHNKRNCGDTYYFLKPSLLAVRILVVQYMNNACSISCIQHFFHLPFSDAYTRVCNFILWLPNYSHIKSIGSIIYTKPRSRCTSSELSLSRSLLYHIWRRRKRWRTVLKERCIMQPQLQEFKVRIGKMRKMHILKPQDCMCAALEVNNCCDQQLQPLYGRCPRAWYGLSMAAMMTTVSQSKEI